MTLREAAEAVVKAVEATHDHTRWFDAITDLRAALKGEDEPPRHAFEVTISIGGDDWDYVLRIMDELADHLREHGPDCNMVSGGGGGSHSVSIAKRDVPPEQFHRELQEWNKRTRKVKGEE